MSTVCAGKLLRIDLTSGAHRVDPISDADVRRYLLGSGLAAKIYYEEMDPSLDALDPASPVLAFNGLLTGTFSPTGCRSSWCGRSPLTGIWNEANVGGHWGAELRFAGFDGLIVTGRAAEPAYLWVHDGEIEVRSAQHLWGLDHFQTFEKLRAETPEPPRFLVYLDRMEHGHEHFLAADRIHLLPHDRFDPREDLESEGQKRVHTRRQFADETGPQHQAVARYLGLRGVFLERRYTAT